MNNNIVEEVLEKTNRQTAETNKSITVDKHVDVELDLGTLLVVDTNDFNEKELRTKPQKYLQNLTRDNTQLLLNAIWELPTERLEEIIVAKLPKPITRLPRSKCIPKPRAPTKWEKFAKEKGIQKKKKSNLTWDEQLQKWIPNYGYKRTVAENEKQWVIEVPQNVDPNTDMFSQKSTAKTERVAKNELQRLRNIAKHKGVKVPRMGITSSDKLSSNQLLTASTVAKASTASLGKFQPKLPKEKEVTGKGIAEITPGVGKKRKAQHFLSSSAEKERNLATVTALLNKRPTIDIEKAVNKQIFQEQIENSENRQTNKSKNKGNKKSSKKGRGAGKPAAGKGKRNPNKRTLGRKRR